MFDKVLTYTPSDVTIIICDFIVTGMVSCSLQWSAPPYKLVRGCRGINTRVGSKDLSATMNLEVLQTTVTNEVLFQLLYQDRRNQSARLDITIKDNSGDTILYSDSAYVASFPDMRYSDSFDNRNWKIEMLNVRDGQISSNDKGGLDVFGEGGIARRVTDLIF
ncbi:baseplate protein [Pseudomonas phage vB_PseuGesM_254]|uniref:Baseplate protein n=1 Tax=Pseudomonas phage vB_PseuGesM_254 TaxID=3092638 RepID=A0AAX4G6E4_9CAUD|nr:baseplate protein [Pseudomonas phage PseuGes_254]